MNGMICNQLLLYLFGTSVYLVIGSVAHEAIINGDTPNPGQFPYQVSLQHGGVHFCAGGIIDAESILTVAHCFIDIYNRFDNLRVTAFAGVNYLNESDRRAVTLEVTRLFITNEYHPKSRYADIAVLKLNGAFKFRGSVYLLPLHLPRTRFEQYSGETGRIAGWGWNWIIEQGDNREIGGHNSTLLRYLKANILSYHECDEAGIYNMDAERQFCARAEQHWARHSVCMFDNGGPLVHNGTVIGILSKVPPGCNETYRPGIYTRVAKFLTFIDNAINNRKTIFMHSYNLPHH